jgi:hypothetical protein
MAILRAKHSGPTGMKRFSAFRETPNFSFANDLRRVSFQATQVMQ